MVSCFLSHHSKERIRTIIEFIKSKLFKYFAIVFLSLLTWSLPFLIIDFLYSREIFLTHFLISSICYFSLSLLENVSFKYLIDFVKLSNISHSLALDILSNIYLWFFSYSLLYKNNNMIDLSYFDSENIPFIKQKYFSL